jgi:TolA-binding protein
MEDRLRELEGEISETESAIEQIEIQMQLFVSAEETQRQTQELVNHKGELKKLLNEWEELSKVLS